MLKNKKLLVITSVVTLLPILVGLLLWNQLPEKMPTHWNGAGEIDGWSSRPFAVFALPLFMFVMHWFCILVSAVDPKNKNQSGKAVKLVFWIVPVISILCSALIYLTALGVAVSVNMAMPLVMGLLFVLIGNYLPKCKQNYTIGIKVPWALENEENWNRTHRFAGKIWIVGGVCMMISSALPEKFMWGVFLAASLVMAFAPMGYSYLYYRKNQTEK